LIIIQILFWICIYGVTHTYFVYPLLLKILVLKKKQNDIVYTFTDDLPLINILISVFNEEKVIGKKLESILKLNYPVNKILVFIGDDGSTDNTASVIKSFETKLNLNYNFFEGRNGKPTLINKLAAIAIEKTGNDGLMLMTDANVLFDTHLVYELAKHFKNTDIGLVGANIKNVVGENNLVGEMEELYISNENKFKYNEGLFNGSLMGAFGACYMLRSSSFVNSPPALILDDFFLCMQVHNQQLKCIYELNAIAYEDLPNQMYQEFKRKCRISVGNYQNLTIFRSWLLKPFTTVGFAFWSHKVLRWLTPFLVIAGLFLISLLVNYNNFYKLVFIYKFSVILVVFFDMILALLNIHIKPLRLVSYFYFMNIALLIGFFKWIVGVRTSAWQSTPRT
jgi:cellulose synthase/poly-beta-1,6-N-acetylglucosamine synthase-like glycosyltransferase